MQTNKVLLPSNSRGKTDEVFVPGLFCKVQLTSVLQHERREDMPSLPEEHMIGELSKYVSGACHRATNAQLLAQVCSTLSKIKSKTRGRDSEAAKARKEEYYEKASKATTHENMCATLVSRLTHDTVEVSSQHSAISPARKRHRTKSAETPPTVKKESDLLKVKQEHSFPAPLESTGIPARKRCTYSYPDTTNVRTRRFVQDLGAQKLTRRAPFVPLICL